MVLGALQWRQLRLDHDSDIASIPRDAQDAVRRLSDAYKKNLTSLLESEGGRPFFEYGQTYFPPGAIGADLVFVPSPLATDKPPMGILGWFQYRWHESPEATEILGGSGQQLESWPQARAELLNSVVLLRQMEDRESSPREYWQRLTQLTGRHGTWHEEGQEIPVVAVNLSEEKDVACLREALPALRDLESQIIQVKTTVFHVRFFLDVTGAPHAMATRMVAVGGHRELRNMPSCFQVVKGGDFLIQGFELDPLWLLDSLPNALALTALDPSQRLLEQNEAPPPGSHVENLDLLSEMGFEIPHREDADPYVKRIAIDQRSLDARLRSRELSFLSVAGMLVLSLGTGLVLLFRSVQRDLDSARRTENFVSAVTHELRTPLSAIKLYGEMLAEGWVSDDNKRMEYYRRILRESTRLETLVERVLHKGQLTRNELEPEPGDLVRAIEPLVPLLEVGEGPDPARDLTFELPTGLPLVMLHTECVRSIVTNLVENARKYAPVDLANPASEPIRVRVALFEREVRLEVLDRGPGIPLEERSRIFQAFYRIGNEQTRASKGTGLGLHLVALQAEAMGAKVEALEREGGGTLFRVTFELAEEPGP
ncbi:MAG: HAMP domain-containing histidine kinase [Planctomycetes bacterium]|nr:HAMP domain-containing histidine kinase [Planctomycetota bacterium]